MPAKPRIKDIIEHIVATEKCDLVEALMVFGHRAVLAGMSRIPHCYKHLILKGGTALHLAQGAPIGRISTDMDLSLLDVMTEQFDHTLITHDVAREIITVLHDALSDSAKVTIQAPIDRTNSPYPEQPDLYQFRIIVAAVLSGNSATIANGKRFIIELSTDEYIDDTLLEELDIAPYGLPIRMRMYAPIQSIAEKLRAILQKHQHFDRKGNVASFQPRHVLDLVPLMARIKPGDLEKLPALFAIKCDSRLVPSAERTFERMTNPVLRERVGTSVMPHRHEAWATLERLATLVCQR